MIKTFLPITVEPLTQPIIRIRCPADVSPIELQEVVRSAARDITGDDAMLPFADALTEKLHEYFYASLCGNLAVNHRMQS